MDPFGTTAILTGLTVATLLAFRAVRKQSLTPFGAAAGFCVGFLLMSTGLRGFNLIVFYQFGSWATKYKRSLKAQKDATASESSVRGAFQVLACSVIAVVLSLIHALYCGPEKAINFESDPLASQLSLGVLAHHACCLADTLASELGILARQEPVLITKPWKRVPPGTNGGITLAGTVWGAAGGALIGLSTLAMDAISGIVPFHIFQTIGFGALCGLLGSIIDSLLGATLQETYYDPDTKLVHHADSHPKQAKLVSGLNLMNNEQVNLASVALTTVLGGWFLGPLMFS